MPQLQTQNNFPNFPQMTSQIQGDQGKKVPNPQNYKIVLCKNFEKEGVSVFIGDQNNPEHLEECIKTYGADYDLIVDDGSHYGEHIVTSFKTLYPYLKEGGIYIIEDLHAAQLDEHKMIAEIKALKYPCKEFYQTHHNKLLIIVK